MYLNDLKLKDKAIITKVEAPSNIKQRLMDLGFTKGVKIIPMLENLGKNMIAYSIKGSLIALRKEDTKDILVIKI